MGCDQRVEHTRAEDAGSHANPRRIRGLAGHEVAAVQTVRARQDRESSSSGRDRSQTEPPSSCHGQRLWLLAFPRDG